MQMQSIFFLVLLVSSINTWFLQLMEAKVFVVLMEDNPRSDEDAVVYKERLISGHDIFLDSVLQRASTAAGNHLIPVVTNNFNYGYASGMAPAARNGSSICYKAGVFVVQAAGNGGPSSSSIRSFRSWITSVTACITDRKYNNSIQLGDGQRFTGAGLAPPTTGEILFPIAAAADVSQRNTTAGLLTIESCQNAEPFVPSLVRGKLIICTYTFDFDFESASIATVADTIHKVGAAGFILTIDPDIGSEQIKGTMLTLRVAGIVLNNMQSSAALWEYYNMNTIRSRSGRVVVFTATARILDGRRAIYTREAPVVASYSSRGPDVNNALLQTADVLKPNIMAPGSSIWAAWSPNSEGDHYIKGQEFALVSGTSMATPHIAGVAALIKQKHPIESLPLHQQ
ncbi:Subtilisin-like protease SBT2.5 [Camellia lanceoleosa]|uniref:Subtilisin-like protease SBT2.5 n=1 Tax=Camellia lanceoleosa TaxID=1840588 RepID=A0ACC0FLB8_9ERIC|nr:Subtilisin-like protease SBT2.5 [Camellia lanceoleosa]